MYPYLLDCGVRPDEFWEYSFGELMDILESHNRQYRQQLKEKVSLQFMSARVIVNHLSMMMDNNISPILPWDEYPKLFEKEKEEYEKLLVEQQIQKAKENRRAYAEEFNRRRRQGLN